MKKTIFAIFALGLASGAAMADAPFVAPERVIPTALTQPLAENPAPARYPVSLTGPNRIAIENAKILHCVHDQAKVEIQADETTGQIFIFPRTADASTLFLTTDTKETVAVTIVPQAIASQNIVLAASPKPVIKPAQPAYVKPVLRAHSMDATVKHLIAAMARHEVPAGFDTVSQVIKTDATTKIVKRYVSDAYVGEVLRYTNTGKKSVTLDEALFYEAGVLAVAIDSRDLKPTDTTTVYRVLLREGSAL
ncbi:MAG: type-F conjugative transfer system secretin TraK [Burkholderiaceae bacterium]|nr:type-F conjugative transfer system secretin TraK [Burkholderiaceae bacterium]